MTTRYWIPLLVLLPFVALGCAASTASNAATPDVAQVDLTGADNSAPDTLMADVSAPNDALADAAADGGAADAGAELPGADAPGGDVPTASPDVTASAQGIWTDPTTGLIWQDPTTQHAVWSASFGNPPLLYCENLELGGFSDWRLPNIDELRTLLRGCAQPSCNISAAAGGCLDKSCTTTCPGCTAEKGPGSGKCYWDAAMGTSNCIGYWSSTPVSGAVNLMWFVNFWNGAVNVSGGTTTDRGVRCVRGKML